ncbi:MAG: PcfJ domain-containing protein [Bacteroidota bacterium]
MDINHSIHIDWCEERFPQLKECIEEDANTFIRKELRSLYWAFQSAEGSIKDLTAELTTLIKTTSPSSANGYVLIDDWTVQLHGSRDLITSNHCRDLLLYLYSDFEQSQAFKRLYLRFGMSQQSFFDTASNAQLLNWLVWWMVHCYPQLALFIFGRDRIKPFVYFSGVALLQTIDFLPEFMLWRIHTCLNALPKRQLLKALAEGKHLRKIKTCPMPFSKRMAHLFVNAPKEFSFDEAVWYALVKGWGGDERLLKAMQTQFGHWEQDMRMLKIVISFFVAQKEDISSGQYLELLGYLRHLWDESGYLPIKGWTLKSLSRRAEEWQEEVQRRHLEEMELRHRYGYAGPPVYKCWEGAKYKEMKMDYLGDTYQIVQLRDSSSLSIEGRKMRHCVGSYVNQCIGGQCSIWSLRRLQRNGDKSLVTIEVNKNHRITQARRKCNGAPERWQWKLIKYWAEREKIAYR